MERIMSNYHLRPPLTPLYEKGWITGNQRSHSDVWKSLWTTRGKTKEAREEAEESRITSIGVNCIRLCKEIYFPANSYSFMYHQSHIVVLLIRLIKGGASKTAVELHCTATQQHQ